MMRRKYAWTFALGAAAVSALCVQSLAAQGSLDDAINKMAAENKKLAKSQDKIQNITQETTSLLDQYRAAQKRMDALRVYNGQLSTLLASQQTELDSLREQIDRVTVVGRQITPLMLRMIESLEQFIELDVPFLLKERTERVATLSDLMGRADVEDSEKFRRLMEAYQIENEYGRTIEAYRAPLEKDGQKRTVDFLRFGRVALVYQSLGGEDAGRWDIEERTWKPLTREEMSSLPNAFRIARNQTAPDLVRLPVPAPEAAK